jgi:hypothetical protein
MDPLLQEVIRQFGIVSAALALIVALVVSTAVSWFISRDKQATQARHERELEVLRGELRATEHRLNARFETQVHVSKARFETEFSIYKNVWARVIEAERRIHELRPIVDFVELGQSEDERKLGRLEGYVNAHNDLVDAVKKNQPFYAPAVYSQLLELLQLLGTERIEYEYGDKLDEGYWESARENIAAIRRQVDALGTSIRLRFQELAVSE